MVFIVYVELKLHGAWCVILSSLLLFQVEKLMRKKQMDVADFSVYWDTSCTLLGDLPPGQLQVHERGFAYEREVAVSFLSVLKA